MLSTAREHYKNTFSKIIFNISYSKNSLETEVIFLREESMVKNKNMTIKNQGRWPKLRDGRKPETRIFFCLAKKICLITRVLFKGVSGPVHTITFSFKNALESLHFYHTKTMENYGVPWGPHWKNKHAKRKILKKKLILKTFFDIGKENDTLHCTNKVKGASGLGRVFIEVYHALDKNHIQSYGSRKVSHVVASSRFFFFACLFFWECN